MYVCTYVDEYQQEDLDGALSFALTQLFQKILAKTSLFSSAAISTFDPCDVIFHLT